MKIKSITDIGVKRKDNQDNYWSALFTIDTVEYGVLCLCDGMGGLKNGALASRIVVEAIRDSIKAGFSFEDLKLVIEKANKDILSVGRESGRMGTTCTLVLCSEGKYRIWHVGDSRCYVFAGGKLQQLTTDHSALQKYGITREENPDLWNKYKNTLTKCIGVNPTIELDYYEGDYSCDSVFFVCSDGMWHSISKKIDKDSLLDLNGLVELCKSLGETDNITASLLIV